MTDLELNLLSHAQLYSNKAADLFEQSTNTNDKSHTITALLAAEKALFVIKAFASMAKAERHGLSDTRGEIITKLAAEIETLEKALK